MLRGERRQQFHIFNEVPIAQPFGVLALLPGRPVLRTHQVRARAKKIDSLLFVPSVRILCGWLTETNVASARHAVPGCRTPSVWHKTNNRLLCQSIVASRRGCAPSDPARPPPVRHYEINGIIIICIESSKWLPWPQLEQILWMDFFRIHGRQQMWPHISAHFHCCRRCRCRISRSFVFICLMLVDFARPPPLRSATATIQANEMGFVPRHGEKRAKSACRLTWPYTCRINCTPINYSKDNRH